MNATIADLKNSIDSRTDTQLTDCLALIEIQLNAITSPRSELAQSLRLVRMSIIEVLEKRHPELDIYMEEWSLSLTDERTYVQALIDGMK